MAVGKEERVEGRRGARMTRMARTHCHHQCVLLPLQVTLDIRMLGQLEDMAGKTDSVQGIPIPTALWSPQSVRSLRFVDVSFVLPHLSPLPPPCLVLHTIHIFTAAAPPVRAQMQRRTFVQKFVVDMAKQLGVDESRIEVEAVTLDTA